jgi:basic membrane protein A
VAIRKLMVVASLALVAVVALTVASIGSAKPEADSAIKVAVVTDIGGLNDKGFNALAAKGMNDIKKTLGLEGRIYISKTAADYIPNLSRAAREGYDLIISNGFLLGDATAAVARRFPDTKFAIIDYPWVLAKGKPKNFRGLVFKEADAGYLAGVAAATVAKGSPVSFVGGQDVPAVVAFRAGYKAGVAKTNAKTKFISGYSQEFVDQAKCKELALTQIQAGAKVVFAAAGGCGLGALQAAKEQGVWGIGVDSDQAYLGTHILTSATKKVDVAVLAVAKLTADGKYKGGTDSVFTVANGGVGFGKVSVKAPNRAALIAKLTAVSKQLASGQVKPPTK